ncbi:conserved Plasmodium protein, unknown function [Plasmodium gallinaceum]|uniref:Uncharacterized protein n=1 Tax=Plasmodium gallinaceum TaxID=5849 RepID=A0A1J1GXM8_PLAGA|nr:conserved Plasmodium protein, unknown function [Plasmodium gallinaceum]CRG95768.1 conserved Plasmodium protein, unknown function [Plasmodium gallinaceum]
MNYEEEKKIFNLKLCEELRKIKGYKIIQNALKVKKKKKGIKKGLLYNLIELKYINKILYQLYFHKKCMKNFIDDDNLFCYIRKIIQIKKNKNIVVNYIDTHIDTSLHFINCNKNFYIFCKINHYVNKELFNINNTSSIILFFYEPYYDENETSNRYLNSFKLSLKDKHFSKYLCKNNFHDTIIKKNNDTNKNKKFNKGNKYTFKNEMFLDKKRNERNISTKKIVDYYLLLINYESCNKILHFSFFHTFQKILYKFLYDKKSYDEIIKLTNVHNYHKINNYKFIFKHDENVYESKNVVKYDTTEHIKLKIIHFIKEKKKFSYFLSIFYNKCNLTRKENNSQKNIKGSFKNIIDSLKKYNKIYIYSNILKKEKEFFLTFNNINKCFFIFIFPILLYFNKKNCLFLKINSDNKKDINLHLIFKFLNELFLLIRTLYSKKKLIKKLKKYISNRTLKGYLNYNFFNNHKSEKGKKKKYIYTFHSILDNFVLVQENYHINNKLFLKIKKIFLKIELLNKNIILNFVEKKFEKLCETIEDLLKWNWKFRNANLSKNEHMYVYFLEKKENRNVINKNSCYINNTNNIRNNNYCIKNNNSSGIILYNNNNNNNSLSNRNRENFHLICIFKITSIKDKILKVAKNICIYILHFFGNFEKFNNFDKIYILKHFLYIINKLPYLYICYMKRRKWIHLFFRRYIYYSNSLHNNKSIKDKYSDLLKFFKKKKWLKNIFINEDVFLFLLKMQKLLLYFYLYLLGIFFRNTFSFSSKMNKVGIKESKMKSKFFLTKEMICDNFDILIKKIKKKEKEKIYIYFLKNENMFLNFKNNNNQSKKTYSLLKKNEEKKNKIVYVSKIVCIEKYLERKEEKKMKLLDKNKIYQSEMNLSKNNINKAVELTEPNIEINENFEEEDRKKNTDIKDETFYNFFKLKNMKKTFYKYMTYIIEKTKEKIKREKNIFFLNANLHKLKLLKIVNTFQHEIKIIMELIYKMNDSNRIAIDNNKQRNQELNFIDHHKIDKLLFFINKKIRINKNLCIFNISNEIIKKKIDFTKLININNKIIHNLVINGKQSFNKIFMKNKLITYKMTLNYLIYFINGHISYSINIFTNNYEKLNKSNNIYFLNLYKNSIIKNKFIETTMYFLEYIFTYISDIVTFIKNNNMNKKKKKNPFNICKIFCYKIVQNKCVLSKIYKGKKKGDFFLNIFIFFKEKVLFFYSFSKYDNGDNLFNPFFVKMLNNNKYYDVFLDSSNFRMKKN